MALRRSFMTPATMGLPAAREATSPLVCATRERRGLTAAEPVTAERRRSRSGAMETDRAEGRRWRWEGDGEKTHVGPSFRARVLPSSSCLILLVVLVARRVARRRLRPPGTRARTHTP
uniref:Uncharacterized protein n=1 Tax=Arundo donax TaxID=35708 RepID=A0A0A9EEY2_ARUDO